MAVLDRTYATAYVMKVALSYTAELGNILVEYLELHMFEVSHIALQSFGFLNLNEWYLTDSDKLPARNSHPVKKMFFNLPD